MPCHTGKQNHETAWCYVWQLFVGNPDSTYHTTAFSCIFLSVKILFLPFTDHRHVNKCNTKRNKKKVQLIKKLFFVNIHLGNFIFKLAFQMIWFIKHYFKVSSKISSSLPTFIFYAKSQKLWMSHCGDGFFPAT